MRKWISVLLLVVFLGNLAFAQPQDFPEINAVAVVIYDADFDQMIYGKNPHDQRSIASLTKIMTMLYVCELVEQGKIALDDVVTASSNAASRDGTEIKLKAGDKFTVEELLYASALASANDAAVALAEYTAGSEAEFAKLMTKRAREMGLTDTNFVDCTGLLSIYSGNYSTAYEMAVLSRIAMENELFKRLVSTKEYELKPQNRTIRNSNVLLHEVEGVNGIKTGATTPAGHTLITSVERNGRSLIIVVLGAPSRESRNEQSEALVEYAYSKLKTIIPAGQAVTQVKVTDGVTHLVDAVLERDLSMFAFEPKDAEIDTKIELKDNRAPVDKGDKVGELVIIRNGEEYGRMDLVSNQNTGLASVLRRLWNRIVEFFSRLF
ncbi:MAG: D-alanyl-D-alanine carboxypeptidase family protein [Candidatus Wallacebacter cryptica]|jgi:D-alanyl-D-alanine carboxypeptidase (penicillin-binding protein 5/6)